MKYGEALKYQRELHNYSQSALSKATGISQPKISYYESDKHIPSLDDCIILAKLYEIKLEELIGIN